MGRSLYAVLSFCVAPARDLAQGLHWFPSCADDGSDAKPRPPIGWRTKQLPTVVQIAETVLKAIEARGRQALPLENIYRHLYNPDLFLRAYGRIAQNAGATTQGITNETADGMSMEKINTLIEQFRCERYQWTPVKRTYVPKKNGKRRPLGIPVWSDRHSARSHALHIGSILRTAV